MLIRQRPQSGLLARMWELPHWPAPPAEGGATGALLPEAAALDRLRRSLRQAGIPARPEGHWTAAEHTFSHIVWTLQVYICREEDALALPLAAEARASYGAAAEPAAGKLPAEPFADGDHPEDAGAVRWIRREDMAGYAFPNVFLKLLNSYFDEAEKEQL